MPSAGLLREGKMANWFLNIFKFGVDISIKKRIDEQLEKIKETNGVLEKLVDDIDNIRLEGASAMGEEDERK